MTAYCNLFSVEVAGSPAPEVEWRIQGQRGQQAVVLNQANPRTDTYILHPTLEVRGFLQTEFRKQRGAAR